MAWIRSDTSLPRHPKTKRLARMLGISIPQAIGHLHALWYWCYEYAPDGDLSAYDASDIAEAGMWDGDPDVFVRALVECGPNGRSGFLDQADGGLRVHDWEEFAGRLIEQRERAKERARRWRRGANGDGTENIDETNGERTRNVRVRNAYGARNGGVTYGDRTRNVRVRNENETNNERATNGATNDTNDTYVTEESSVVDSLPSVENQQHAQGASGGEDSSRGEEKITNRDLIAELVASYRALPGIQPAKGDYAFIGRMYNDFGYDVVLEAINELAYRLESGGKVSNPLVYLKGICKRQAGETPQLKVIPGGEAAASKEPGDAWSRGWRPYYRKVTDEEIAYYLGETTTPPPHLRSQTGPPDAAEGGAADG